VKSIKATLLAAKDIYAHNSFESPRNVQPVESQVANTRAGAFVDEFAPASVTKLQITLE
jgi:alpha-L-arabinofuranosidase